MRTELEGTGPICGPPAWKVSAFAGADIVTAQVFWEGLWMNCVIRRTGRTQRQAYDSVLLRASRALACVSLAAGALASGLSVPGARRTSFLRHHRPTKNNAGPSAGAAVYVGWATGAPLVIGGALACSAYPC
ncbi:claudin-4 [Phyllopteryx taeniolatus]|uniref:claudin-4 n=1 Tax=Phyllopteryx taeniolatus TaxID=161469 RepID=UPI002AD350F5|nr:claudin-4 [Phyllopteryx taeniolatus]